MCCDIDCSVEMYLRYRVPVNIVCCTYLSIKIKHHVGSISLLVNL